MMGIINPPRLPDGPCTEYDDSELSAAIRYAMQCIALDRPSEYLRGMIDEARRRETDAAARFQA